MTTGKNADLIVFVLFQKWKEVRYKDDKQFCSFFSLAVDTVILPYCEGYADILMNLFGTIGY